MNPYLEVGAKVCKSGQTRANEMSLSQVLSMPFGISNPTPKLLQLIRAHPNVRTITILVIIYIEMDPTQLDKLTGALVDLKNSNETVAGYDNPIQILIADSLRVELHDLLRSELGPEDGALQQISYRLTTLCHGHEVWAFGLPSLPLRSCVWPRLSKRKRC